MSFVQPRMPTEPRPIFVQCLSEIEYLIKESEIMTGELGRIFWIASADRIAYRIFWCANQRYVVQRLDAAEYSINSQHLSDSMLEEHSVGHALCEGYLMTSAIDMHCSQNSPF